MTEQMDAPFRMRWADAKKRKRARKPSEPPPDALVDRLEGLLPREALEDALQGLGPGEITGPGGLLSQLAGRVIETALGAELTEHLGHPPGGVPAQGNVRNGATAKRLSTDLGGDPDAARPRRLLRAQARRRAPDPPGRPGLNSNVRLISHRSFGFHGPEPLIALIHLCAGGIVIDRPFTTNL